MEKSHCSYVRSWAVLSMVQFASAYECKISFSSPPKVKGEFEKLLLVEVYSVCWTISPDVTELSPDLQRSLLFFNEITDQKLHQVSITVFLVC